MRKTWFTHPDPIDTKTADELIASYKSRNIQAKKCLAFDPCYWLVSALLPEFRNEPIPSRQYKNPMWS